MGDDARSTLPISFVLLNSAVASTRTFRDWVWTIPPGAVTFRAFRMSLIFVGCNFKAASRASEYSR